MRTIGNVGNIERPTSNFECYADVDYEMTRLFSTQLFTIERSKWDVRRSQ